MDLLNEARLEKIGELLSTINSSQDRVRALNSQPLKKSAFLDLSQRDLERYDFAKAVSCQLEIGRRPEGLEFECSQEIKRRLNLDSGGIAIPLDAINFRGPRPPYSVGASAPEALTFSDLFRNASYILRLGAQRLADLRDDVSIPRQISDPTLTWLAPGSTAAPSEAAFGQLTATPKQAIVLTEVSEQLLRQSSADRVVRAGLAAALGAGIDAAVINGPGGAAPLGLFNVPQISSAAGGALGYAGLVGVQKTVADANGILNPDSMGYLTTPLVAELLKNRQRFPSSDSPLWHGAVHDGKIEGVRAMATRNVPTASLIFGDFSTIWLCEWGPLLLAADRGGSRFNQGIVAIRATWLVDVLISSPSSFVKITAIT